MTDHSPEARLEALEMRITYQDDTIEKLNAAIAEQWGAIDTLNRLVGQLRDRLQEAESRTAPPGPVDETPPHY